MREPAVSQARLWASRLRGAMRRQGALMASIGLFAVIWEVAGRTANLLVLPPLSKVLASFWRLLLDGTLTNALQVSAGALVTGMLLAIVVGILIGTLMALIRPVEWALDVYINALMAAPMVAFVPLFIMLFGLGYPTRVVTVFLFAFFPIVVNTFAGMRYIDPTLIEMGSSFGASRRQLFWQVRVPNAFGYVRAGLRLSTARGVDGLITGEVLIAVVGLGGLVIKYGRAFSMDRLYAVSIFIVLVAVIAVRIVDVLSRRVIRHDPTLARSGGSIR